MGKAKELAHSDEELIEKLSEGDDATFKAIYANYREEFLKWAETNFNVDQEVALDFYQESMVGLYFNAYSGRLTKLSATLKTYIFSMAKNHLMNSIKSNKRVKLEPDISEALQDDPSMKVPPHEINERAKRVSQLMNKMGEPCRSILELSFLKNFSNEAIANRLGYKSQEVVKATKWRCIQSLRKKLKIE